MEVTQAALHVSVSIPFTDAGGVSEARRFAQALAEAALLGEPAIGRALEVLTEAAGNALEHAAGGEVLLRRSAPGAPAMLEILVLDRGPGMANVAHAMRDGFSTKGSPGLGLSAIARLSDCLEISSAPGKGTALLARIGERGAASRGPPEPLEWGVVCVPKQGETMCGDAWAVESGRDRTTVLMVDGLGHGPPAFEAAQQALATFKKHSGERPEAHLRALHASIRETRGAVAAVVEIDWQERQVRYAGAGNISGTLVPLSGPASNMVSQNGTVGEKIVRIQEFRYPWPDRGLILLHSDGLSPFWELEPYPGLSQKDPSLIAGVLYRDFGNRRDDCVVFVGRERPRDALGPTGGAR